MSLTRLEPLDLLEGVLIEAVTFRIGGHSTSDDPTKYVDADLLSYWKERDPIVRFSAFLCDEGLLDDAKMASIQEEAEAEMLAAARAAESKPVPMLTSVFEDVFEGMPKHLERQSEFCVDHYSSRGEGVNEKGEFPL